MKLSLWIAMALISLIALSVSLFSLFADEPHSVCTEPEPIDTIPFISVHERFIPGDTSSAFWLFVSHYDSTNVDVAVIWHSQKGWNDAMEALQKDGIDTCSIIWK